LKYKSFYLIAGDIILAFFALFTGFMIRFGYVGAKIEYSDKPFARLLLFVVILVLCSYIFDVYNIAKHRNTRELIVNISIAVCVSFMILSICYFMLPRLIIGRGLLALSLIMFIIYQFLWHVLFVMVYNHPVMAEKILILGTGPSAQHIGGLIHSPNNSVQYILVGYVSGQSESKSVIPEGQVVGTANDLLTIVEREKVSIVVVSRSERRGHAGQQHILLNCKLRGVEVMDTPTFLEQLTGKLMLENMDMNWLIYSDGFRRTFLYAAVKRTIDVFLSFVGIVVSFPFFPFVAALIKLDSPGPVFFTQTRVGQGEKNFTLYKFRTMGENSEEETGAVWAQENDPRIRPIGRFLRKWRIDELPQLYNVIKGDMSFVGPRPERPEFVTELDRQIPFYAKRHFIKPGITGWAQVKYPYGASVEDAYEKLRYDLYYFKNMCFFQDIKIILQTFRVVIFGRGR
jgi:sugar transferase (PEP-CTERM system associated)